MQFQPQIGRPERAEQMIKTEDTLKGKTWEIACDSQSNLPLCGQGNRPLTFESINEFGQKIDVDFSTKIINHECPSYYNIEQWKNHKKSLAIQCQEAFFECINVFENLNIDIYSIKTYLKNFVERNSGVGGNTEVFEFECRTTNYSFTAFYLNDDDWDTNPLLIRDIIDKTGFRCKISVHCDLLIGKLPIYNYKLALQRLRYDNFICMLKSKNHKEYVATRFGHLFRTYQLLSQKPGVIIKPLNYSIFSKIKFAPKIHDLEEVGFKVCIGDRESVVFIGATFDANPEYVVYVAAAASLVDFYDVFYADRYFNSIPNLSMCRYKSDADIDVLYDIIVANQQLN